MGDRILKVDPELAAKECSSKLRTKRSIGNLQVAVYVMCGGGRIGRFAAEQPADFYIDARVDKLPYSVKAIYQTVKVLAALAEKRGLDPQAMPKLPGFHASGVF